MKKVIATLANPEPLARNIEKSADIQRLHELMPTLSDEGITALYFRFWECLLIEDIANILGRSWDYTDLLIENSIKELRRGFLMKPEIAQPKAA